MLHQMTLKPSRTYASKENAENAVIKCFSAAEESLRYFIVQDEHGRYFPVFVGQEAVRAGIFTLYPVVA